MNALKPRIAAVLTAVTLAPLGWGQHTGKVTGMTVITNDGAVIAKARAKFRSGMALGDLRKEFEPNKFEFKEWGQRSVCVIDQSSGPIGDLINQLAMIKVMTEKLGDNLTFRLGDGISDNRNAASEFLQQFIRPEMLKGGKGAFADVQVGLEVVVNYTVEKDGKRITLEAPTDNPNTEKRTESLRTHPLARRELSKRDVADLNKAAQAENRHPDELTFHYLGSNRGAVREASIEATKILGDLLTRLEGERVVASQDLLKKFGLKGAKLPEGEAPLSELPKEVQDRLLSNVKGNFKYFGFSNAAEAENFVLGCKSVIPSTSLGLMICENGGTPPQFGTFIFSTFRGGIAP